MNPVFRRYPLASWQYKYKVLYYNSKLQSLGIILLLYIDLRS